MKLTEQQLKKIIQEELSLIDEAGLIDKFRKGFQQGKDWWNKKPAAGGSASATAPAAGSPAPAAAAAGGAAPAGPTSMSGQQPKPQIDPVAGWKQLEPLLKQAEARYKQQGKPFNADAFKFAFYEMAREDFSKMSPQEMNNQFTKLPSELRKKAYELLTGQKPTGAAASATAPSAANNPKLTKRMELFKQNMPQYFDAIQKQMALIIQKLVSTNVQALKEQGEQPPSTPYGVASKPQGLSSADQSATASKAAPLISSLISKEISKTLNDTLKSITAEEFQQAYQIFAKKKIKDPKELSNVLKTYRGLEEQEEVQVNPLQSSEMDLLDTILQVKKINLSNVIRQAAEKAVSNPQIKKFLPDDKAKNVIKSLSSSIKSIKQLISSNPNLTAQTIKKSQFPDATRQEPAPASPADVKPTQQANTEKNENKKASLNENKMIRMKLLAGIIKK